MDWYHWKHSDYNRQRRHLINKQTHYWLQQTVIDDSDSCSHNDQYDHSHTKTDVVRYSGSEHTKTAMKHEEVEW